ncbi:hypothetical protein [Nocardioides sp. GXZ039]|uniref:hypothetical protein n=1 Tax=Nocardioides sp. GXZ039 TaxID=3136018 RepID=UPI0030F4503F
MCELTIKEAAEGFREAKRALALLHAHPRASRRQLGAARDRLNLIRRLSDDRDLWNNLYALECMVRDIYGTETFEDAVQLAQDIERATGHDPRDEPHVERFAMSVDRACDHCGRVRPTVLLGGNNGTARTCSTCTTR